MSPRKRETFGGTGTPIPGSRCPRCGAPMEYNGNYWCSECPWVLPEHPRTVAERTAFEVAYVLYMKQTGREPDPDVITRGGRR